MENKLKRILFVDDEQNVLDGLRRMLYSLRLYWDMEFVRSGEQALKLMAEAPFDVVVTDMRMPGMDGVELLIQVAEKYPSTIRFVLSGQSDSRTLLRASTITHKVLSKPIDADFLRILLSRALALRQHLNSVELRETLTRIGSLPTMPGAYARLLQEMQSPDTTIQRIAGIIEEDMALSAKILQVANSAAVGVRHSVTSVLQAANMLGMSSIKNFALTASAFSDAERENLPKDFDMDALWRHCLKVASYAKAIAQEVTKKPEAWDEAFMAGLLHQVGQVVLATKLPREYEQALEIAKKKKITIERAEKEVFGSTNAEVGGFLLELWGIPDSIVEAITFHLYPSGIGQEEVHEETFASVTALHVARYFAEDGHLAGRSVAKPEADLGYLERLGYLPKMEAWFNVCAHVQEGNLDPV